MTPHLYRTPGYKAPLLHLRRRGPDGLYANYLGHFDRVGDDASEVNTDGDERWTTAGWRSRDGASRQPPKGDPS